MEKYFVILLSQFEFYGNTGVTMSRICEEVLSYCKNARKDLSKEDLVAKGYDIYAKKEMSIAYLIDGAIYYKYIELNPDYELHYQGTTELAYRITKEGIEFLKSTYSNNFCDEYIKFKNEVLEALRNHGESKIKELIIMKAYYNGKSIEETIKFKIEPNGHRNDVLKYQMHIFDKLNTKYSDEDYVFNFRPSLYVNNDLINSKVTCFIDGIEIKHDIKIWQPYPNKKYFVPGIKVDKENFLDAFYLVAPKEKFSESMNLTVYWNIDNPSLPGGNLKLIHHLNLKFAFDDVGNLFSTNQDIFNSDMKCFKLVSCVDNNLKDTSSFYGDRSYTVNTDKQGIIEIFEDATLNNFLIKEQNCFWSDDNFHTWGKQ